MEDSRYRLGLESNRGEAAVEVAVWPCGLIEFERVVPASGNLGVAGKQFWLGTSRAGQVITFFDESAGCFALVGW